MPGAFTHKSKRQFEALVHAHQGHIRAFLRRLCRNDALADDLAQETFLRAYQKYGALSDAGAAKAWLFQIAYRIFLDFVRKEKRRKNLDDERQGDLDEPPETLPEIKMDIERAMNALPAPQRAAIILNISHGLSHGEVARALGMPLGTVKSHIARGKNSLRAFLNAYEKA